MSLGASRDRISSATRWIAERSLALKRMGLALAALTVLCGLVGVLLYQSYLEVETAALTEAGNIAAAIAQDETRNIELLDLSLQGAQETFGDPQVEHLEGRLRRLVLFDRAVTAKDIDAVLVLDDAGNIVADSRFNVPRVQRFGASDFFRAHIHQEDRGLFISRPFLSPFDGDWNIALSRRLSRPDGSFAGVVAGIIKLVYFRRLFDTLDVGPRGVMSLLAVDGTILMSHPYDDGDIGRVLINQTVAARLEREPVGSFSDRSRRDGLQRLYVYRQVGTLPLVQIVGFSLDDLYRPWKQKAAMVVVVLLLFCGAIAGLVFYLQRELGKRIKAEAAFAQLAATDKLTGLPNRRKFDDVLEAEWQRSRRSGLPLSLLMIDVDHFKAYNDAYGHLGGDAVLATLGLRLQSQMIRTTDFAARFGGEEFAVILPSSDHCAATLVAERIRATIEAANQPHCGSPKGFVSISVGAAAMSPAAGQSASAIIQAADAALYRAKAAGRNCIMLADDPAMQNAA